jgi:tripartite-type tricarboxylate transporter receptor subunit TctC
MMTRTVRGALATVATVAAIGSATAASADDFYKGKTITILVGFTPGGGYDAYARLLSQFLAKHVPGHPTVIVQNMPGAGSLTAVRSLDVTQPKDGTVIAIFNPGVITQAIVDPKMSQLDFHKIAWVGVATPDFRVCYGYGPKAPKTWDELMKAKQFILGATGKGSGNYVDGATLRVVFGAPIKQILGFPGSAEQRIAIQQGELDGDCGTFSSIPADWVKKGDAHVFVRFTQERPPEEPESAQYISDLAKTDEQKSVLGFVDAVDEVGRPFVMSGQVPADRQAVLRKAFDDSMKDPALLAEAKKEQLPIAPISGEKATAAVAQILQASPAVVATGKKVYE